MRCWSRVNVRSPCWRRRRTLEVLRAGSEELIHRASFDRDEAAKVPFAHDNLVEEATRLGGSGRMAGVVFLPKFLEIFLEFPDEDLGFGEDAGLEVGVDDASLAFGGGGAVGLASVLTEAAICF